MISKHEIRSGIAELLHTLRTKRGLSKSKMADRLYIDDKTWSRYETGETAPSIDDFIWMLNELQEDVLRPVLDLLYPDTYKSLDNDVDIQQLRRAASHYITHIASERTVRELDFILFGHHGSSVESQMQEFTIIEHLPMQYRMIIAKMVLQFWNLAKSRNELISTDKIMPDIELFRDGIIKAEEATKNFRNFYTTLR